MESHYYIYTDGSCKKKIGQMPIGGWAYLIVKDENIYRSDSGGVANTTNQRMELLAAINAIDFIKTRRQPEEKVYIYSDSAYLVNCYLQGWWKKWQKNGWENSKGESVANQDLWMELIPFFTNKFYFFEKVKGHAENFRNNQADTLAQKAADNLIVNWRGTENVYEK